MLFVLHIQYMYIPHHTVQAAKCTHFYHVCTLVNAWLVDEKHHQRKLQVTLTLKTFYYYYHYFVYCSIKNMLGYRYYICPHQCSLGEPNAWSYMLGCLMKWPLPGSWHLEDVEYLHFLCTITGIAIARNSSTSPLITENATITSWRSGWWNWITIEQLK